MMTQLVNRQWRLKSHPVGYIKETDFEWLEELVPELQEGELLIRIRKENYLFEIYIYL
ncbi:MAG: hypothetical protein ACW97P_12625 [Candidatus Hodarchaeales archaeon]|jgi:NADPH-dependent curcumin reductase CurA